MEELFFTILFLILALIIWIPLYVIGILLYKLGWLGYQLLDAIGIRMSSYE